MVWSWRTPRLLALGTVTALAACSSGPRDPVSFGATPADQLVSPEGQCAGETTVDAAAMPARGIALGMAECQVVRVAGPIEKFEFGTNERQERTLLLTYTQGQHAGIYRFVSGRLVTIERAPAPPPPPKPVRPQRPAKPKPPPPA